MGCNSTFKKRRHSYKGALGVELKVRGIGTNFVVYYSCTSTCFTHRANLLKRIACTRAGGADSFGKKLNLVLEYTYSCTICMVPVLKLRRY